MTPPREPDNQPVAEYARISDDKDKNNLGVLRQLKECRRTAVERFGISPDQIREPYVDNDLSAFSGRRRPHFERLVADIEAGRVGTVVVYDIDRLTRRPSELERLSELAVDPGLRIITVVSGELDLLDEDAEMLAAFKASMGRRESKRTGRRVRLKHDEWAAAGIPKGQPRAYGYLPAYEIRDGKRVWVRRSHSELDETEVKYLREAADRIIKGEGLMAVVADFNERGVKPVKAEQWSTPALREVLLRPGVAGFVVLRGQIVRGEDGEPVVGKWPRVLEPEDWETLRDILTDPSRRTSVSNTGKYLLTHLATCSECGHRLTGRLDKKPGIYRYLCTWPGCRKVAVAMSYLDTFVIMATLRGLADPKLRSLLEYGDETTKTRITELGEAISRDRARRHKILESLADRDDFASEDLAIPIRRLDERIAQNTRLLADVTRHQADLEDLPSEVTPQVWQGLPLARRRALVRLVCKQVVLHPTKKRGRGFDPGRVEFGRQL